MLSDTDCAWAAGVVDGEGCIRLQTRRNSGGKLSYTLRLSVSNTDPAMLKKLVEMFGGGIWPNRSAKGKPVWQWVIWSRNAKRVLDSLLPYLITKADQADVALQAQALIVRDNRPNPNLDKLGEFDSLLSSLKRQKATFA